MKLRITSKQIEEMAGDGVEVLVGGKRPVTKEAAPKKKQAWSFTIQRDDFGRIKTITAEEQ